MSKPTLPTEVEDALALYFDNQATPEVCQVIEHWVAKDPANARIFAEFGYIERMIYCAKKAEDATAVFAMLAEMEESAQAEIVTLDFEAPRQDDPGSLSMHDFAVVGKYVLRKALTAKPVIITGIATAAAAVLLLALILINPFASDTPDAIANFPTDQDPLASEVVAHVRNTLGAEWDGKSHDQGRLHADTRLTLSKGLAEIELMDGAQVIVQAPAVFEITDANAMRLKSGRLVAHVPPTATGFLVATSSARIVDIGTEFGVVVHADGTTEAHVFKGEVQAVAMTNGWPNGEPTLLRQADALTISHNGDALVPSAAQPLAFVRAEEFDRGIKQQDALARRWQAQREELLNDPSVIAYYAFDQPGQATLRESRGETLFDARIVGAQWAAGRIADKGTLQFNGLAKEEHVTLSQAASERLTLTGPYTIATWVKVNELHSKDGWTSILTKGNDSWRLLANLYNGKPRIGFYQSKDTAFGDQIWDGVATSDLELGRWHHVVVTGQPNDDSVTTRLYLDGQLKAEQVLPRMLTSDWPVAFGANAQRPEDFQFDGALEEVVFFNRPVSADEARQFYYAGAPKD